MHFYAILKLNCVTMLCNVEPMEFNEFRGHVKWSLLSVVFFKINHLPMHPSPNNCSTIKVFHFKFAFHYFVWKSVDYSLPNGESCENNV